MSNKLCAKCGEVKPLKDFHVNNTDKSGHQGYCKVCNRLANARWQIKTERRNTKIAIEAKEAAEREVERLERVVDSLVTENLDAMDPKPKRWVRPQRNLFEQTKLDKVKRFFGFGV